MPVGFNSPARNLFLLGSSGAQVVTNFFKTIDQSAGTDGVYLPDEIRYNFADKKFVLAGSAEDSNSKGFGWFEKRDDAGIADWDVRIEAGVGINTTLRAMELDANDNLIVVGKTADIPWIAKYSNGGVIDWQSTTNSGDVEYTGITSDANGNYYACGSTPEIGAANQAQAFVEKFDTNGNPGWGKSAFMLGRDVVLSKIAANTKGEVVAVGYLEDDSADKGYIVKIDTNTGEVLWDRTLSVSTENNSGFRHNVWCQDVFIDSNDQIYIVGRIGDTSSVRSFIAKYTEEGNLVWQKETPAEEKIDFYSVKSDGETEQTVVFGMYYDTTANDRRGMLSKYSKNGNLVWRRILFSSDTVITSNAFGQTSGGGRPQGGYISLDADPSFYYFLFIDNSISGFSGFPDAYTFGKVSSSGNGLGDFQYQSGTGETYNYEILNIQDKVGRLSDGSVRNDSSDLIAYPFNANKILFDDLATQVSNKKRQMDSADSFEYSGSPAIRVADFQELNLLGDTEATPRINDSWTLLSSPGYQPAQANVASSTTLTYTGIDETSVDRLYFSINYSFSSFQQGNSIQATAYLEDDSGGIVNNQTFNMSGLSDVTSFNIAYLNPSGTYRLKIIFDIVTTQPATLSVFITRSRYTLTPGQDGFWKDQSGKGNDIIESSRFPYAYTYTWPTLNAAGYWEFGGNDSISLPDLGVDYSTNLTLEAWVKTTSSNTWNQIVCGPCADILWAVYVSGGSGRLNFGSQCNSPIAHDNESTAIINDGNWYHVMTTYDGANIKHYINGVLDSTFAETNSLVPSGSLRIGSNNVGNGEFMNGDIGEVRIYPRALTPAQVFQNYNATREKYTGVPASTDPGLTSTRTPA